MHPVVTRGIPFRTLSLLHDLYMAWLVYRDRVPSRRLEYRIYHHVRWSTPSFPAHLPCPYDSTTPYIHTLLFIPANISHYQSISFP